MPLVGVDGDVFHLYPAVRKLLEEIFLFIGVEADVAVDTEQKIFLMSTAFKQLTVALEARIAQQMVVAPRGDQIEIGVGIEPAYQLAALMQDIGIERGLDFLPRKFVMLLLIFIGHARLHGVERHEGLVRNHAGQRKAA